MNKINFDYIKPSFIHYRFQKDEFVSYVQNWLKIHHGWNINFVVNIDTPDDYGELGVLYFGIDKDKTPLEIQEKFYSYYAKRFTEKEEKIIKYHFPDGFSWMHEQFCENALLRDIFNCSEIETDGNAANDTVYIFVPFEDYVKYLQNL